MYVFSRFFFSNGNLYSHFKIFSWKHTQICTIFKHPISCVMNNPLWDPFVDQSFSLIEQSTSETMSTVSAVLVLFWVEISVVSTSMGTSVVLESVESLVCCMMFSLFSSEVEAGSEVDWESGGTIFNATIRSSNTWKEFHLE